MTFEKKRAETQKRLLEATKDLDQLKTIMQKQEEEMAQERRARAHAIAHDDDDDDSPRGFLSLCCCLREIIIVTIRMKKAAKKHFEDYERLKQLSSVIRDIIGNFRLAESRNELCSRFFMDVFEFEKEKKEKYEEMFESTEKSLVSCKKGLDSSKALFLLQKELGVKTVKDLIQYARPYVILTGLCVFVFIAVYVVFLNMKNFF